MTSSGSVMAKQNNSINPTHTNSKLSIAPCYWKNVVYIHEKVLLRTFCFIYEFYTIYRLNVEIQYYYLLYSFIRIKLPYSTPLPYRRCMSSHTQPMYQRKKSNNNSSTTDTGNNNNNNMYSRTGTSDIEGGRMRASGRNGKSSTTNNNNNNDTNANILEQQNNERMNELANHVALLKGLTIEIGNEVREQNSLLDNMNDGFTNTRDLLQNSLRRIGSMLEQGGTKHMCYMVLFCVGVMMLLWWLMSSSK